MACSAQLLPSPTHDAGGWLMVGEREGGEAPQYLLSTHPSPFPAQQSQF